MPEFDQQAPEMIAAEQARRGWNGSGTMTTACSSIPFHEGADDRPLAGEHDDARR
jgi:hypothetical protein